MASSPFEIPEPLLIGMSGGQTSGYQLHLFLNHFGGQITGRRKVVFANTGCLLLVSRNRRNPFCMVPNA